MSGKSKIEWTEKTWNPTTGCTRVSAGCDHCYAFQLHDMRHVAWKQGRFPTAPEQYHRPFSQMQFLAERMHDPMKWKAPCLVFVNSMSDLFHIDVPDIYIREVFDVMRATPRHTYQILTKRPERMQHWCMKFMREPLPNVWLGTSVEHQHAADMRLGYLRETPATVRFLSCEPLLGALNLTYWLASESVGWVIVGGESGPHYRPMDITWARAIRDQCAEFGVPFFFKQHGGRTPKAGGRELDGREWNDMPERHTA